MADPTELDELYFGEIEKVLLFISDARQRAQRAVGVLERSGAAAHLVAALGETEGSLADIHRGLMQRTYFAVEQE